MVNELFLFTDGSVNTKTNAGFGAFFVVTPRELQNPEFNPVVQLKRFEETSSVKLELQTLLWALSEIADFNGKVTVYTDSQNITGLPGRRLRLEKNNYFSKNGRRLQHFELYQQFYRITDELDCNFIKIKGHKSSGSKNHIDRLFSLVDRASRNAVRNEKE